MAAKFGYFSKFKTTDKRHGLIQGLLYKAHICKTDKLGMICKHHTSSIKKKHYLNTAHCSFIADATTGFVFI